MTDTPTRPARRRRAAMPSGHGNEPPLKQNGSDRAVIPPVHPTHNDGENGGPQAETGTRASLGERLRYATEERVFASPLATLRALTGAFVIVLAVLGIARIALLWLMGPIEVERGSGGWRQLYLTFLEITDPGSMTQDVDSSGWVKVMAIITGMVGLVLLSALIALLTTALESKLRTLRKGQSRVVLSGHTLILGWSPRVVEILEELVLANESETDPSVVILAMTPKEQIDDHLDVHLKDCANTKVVTRSGSPSSLANLETVSVGAAKSVIVIAAHSAASPEAVKTASDIAAIKSILAAARALGPESDAPIVAEIFGAREREIARRVDDRVVCVDTDDILAKMIVQTSRNSGLSVVYEEMLSFAGNEVYFHRDRWPEGSTFASVAHHLVDGVPVGIVNAGKVRINPPAATRLEPDDELVVVANDDSTIKVADGRPPPSTLVPAPSGPRVGHRERHLIIGWSPKLATMIREFDEYVPPGSHIDTIFRRRTSTVDDQLAALSVELDHIALRTLSVDPFNPQELVGLDLFGYDSIIVLSSAMAEDLEETVDSETLVTLLHLLEVFEHRPEGSHTKLVAELLDSRNRQLISPSGPQELIISNGLVSAIIAQVSEQARMQTFYEDLFSEAGSEIYLKDLGLYVDGTTESLTFSDLLVAASARDEVAIGYRRRASQEDADANFGIELNPPKTSPLGLMHDDFLVVMAEDET